MVSPVVLLKEHQELPDNYGIKVYYVTGNVEDFELASHFLNKETGIMEFWSKENLVNWIPLNSVLRIEFDKRFSKIVDIKNKELNASKQ